MEPSPSARGLFAVVLLLGAALAVPAQERKPVFGRVVDAAGAPVAGAEVTLVWSPPGGPECGATDLVRVTTDERGRFVAQLLPQEGYSAWAVATAANGGEPRTCRIAEGIASGGSLELRLDRRARRHRVELRGGEAWAEVGPLRVLVAPRALSLAFHDLDAQQRTPPLPAPGLAIVLDRRGEVLRMAGLPDTFGDDPLVVPLLPPLTLRLLVQDPDGRPLAGAQVRHATTRMWPDSVMLTGSLFERPRLQSWRLVGTTAADGTVTVTVPAFASAHGPDWHHLLVRAPGCAEAHVAPLPGRNQVAINAQAVQLETVAPIQVTLLPAARLRVADSGRAPGATTEVTEVLLTAAYRGGVHLDRAVPLHLDQDGSCELPIPLHAIETMLHVRTAPGEPWQVTRIPLASGQTTTIDLAWQRRLALQFLDENRGPARGMTGVLMAVGTQNAISQQVLVSTDQAGRLERTVGPDAWILVLCDGQRIARFDVPRADAPGAVREIRATLACEPLGVARFRIRDAAGRPVAGARVGTIHKRDAPAPPRGAAAGPWSDPLLAQLLQELAPQLARLAVSDANGLLRIPVIPPPAPVWTARIGADGHGQWVTDLVDGEVLDVALPAAGTVTTGGDAPR